MRLLAVFVIFLASASVQALPVSRCINLGNALDAPNEGDWGYTIQRHHLTRIADAGFDTVRLPVRFSAHWDGRISPDLLARVDQVIAWALDEGLTVILDLHHFRTLMENPGAHADTFVAIWQELSAHYSGASDGLIFELLNEPSGELTTAKAAELYRRAMPIIRRDNPERWVILGGGHWSDESELAMLPVLDDRTAHTFHFYKPWSFTHQNAPWIENPPQARNWGSASDRERTRRELATGLDHRAAPVLLGEFGVYDAAPSSDAVEWLAFVRKAAEAAGVPWCVWSFSSTFRMFETGQDDWNRERLRAVIPE